MESRPIVEMGTFLHFMRYEFLPPVLAILKGMLRAAKLGQPGITVKIFGFKVCEVSLPPPDDSAT